MTRKNITLAAALVCILAILTVGTVAYFTDTDAKTNTFTTGKVDITLVENFDEENAKLLPGSQTENFVTKEVSIKVEAGSEDSYVWYEWLIPTALDSTDGNTGTNNIIHVNAKGATWDTYRENSKFWAEGQTEALPLEKTWDHDPNVELSDLIGPEGYIGTETIEGIEYNKYVVLYHGVVKAGQETSVAMSQVYMDSKVDTNTAGQYTFDGEVINYDFSKDINIIVRAYGIQAAGMEDVYEAYKSWN